MRELAFLIAAVVSSALVSVLMRFSEKRTGNSMVMFLSNYIVCALLSLCFGLRGGLTAGEGTGFAAGLGVLSGVMYLGSFALLKMNIRKNGVVLSAVFMKLGVLVPTLMAVTVYHERPGLTRVIGFAAAVLAILLINTDSSGAEGGKDRKAALLVVLLLAGGFTDSLSNIFEKNGAASAKDLYLLVTFLSAALISLIEAAVKRTPFTRADVICGAMIGIPNYFSSRFLLLALGRMSAVAVYPAYNVGAILLVTLAGVLVFREHMSRRKWIGMAVIAASLILLNL